MAANSTVASGPLPAAVAPPKIRYAACMHLSFTKMHGLGNDFIVFASPADQVISPSVYRRLADRRTGIGFDQALVLEPARRPGTDLYYRIFNADGSEVEQCGNGARCIAWLVNRQRDLGNQVRMDSAGGLVHATIRPDGQVSVDMGVANFDPKSLPFDAPSASDWYELHAAGGELRIGAVSMGNPHAVLLVDDVTTAPVDTVGPAVENHPRFARRVNVGFMQLVDREHVRLRVFERGAGETLACGTGACAAVAVGRQRGALADSVQVSLPGGLLQIDWQGPGQSLWMTGPVQIAFQGTVEL